MRSFHHSTSYIVPHAIKKNGCVKLAGMQLDALWQEYLLGRLEGKNCIGQRIGCLLSKEDTGNCACFCAFMLANRGINASHCFKRSSFGKGDHRTPDKIALLTEPCRNLRLPQIGELGIGHRHVLIPNRRVLREIQHVSANVFRVSSSPAPLLTITNLPSKLATSIYL